LAATLAVLLVAAVLLGLLAWQYRDDPFARTYVSDALSYHLWAERIAAGGLGAEPVFHQSPLFPVLLGGLYTMGDDDARVTLALLLQLLLLALAVALLVPLGRLWFDSTAAGVAAALVALAHAPIPFHGLKLLPVPLALVTQAGGLVLLGWARRSPRPAAAALAGFAWGLAVVARAEMLLFVPVALAALRAAAVEGRGPTGAGRRLRLVAFLVGVVVAVAPVTLHNARQGDIVLVASAGGENLFIGNQRGASGGHEPLHPQAGDILSQRALAERLAEQELGRELLPSEVSAYWRGRAVDEVLAAPGGWLRLELLKLARILHPGDPTDMYSLPLERDRYLSALWLLPLPAWGLWLLAAYGGPGLAKLRPRVWPLLVFVALHVVLLLAFFVSTRLRLPLLFFLAPFAGHGIVTALRDWSAGRRVRVLGLAGLLALVTLGGAWSIRASPREILRLASVLSTQERLDDSLDVLGPVIAEPTPYAPALDQAGWVLYRMGRAAEARDAYLRALEIGLPGPREAQTRTRLAWAFERLERYDEALEQHDAAVTGGHSDAGSYYERGLFRLRRGDRAGGEADLLEAARLDPDWRDPREALEKLQSPGR
jgi:tetratricopeptide (TPR) repeat protein